TAVAIERAVDLLHARSAGEPVPVRLSLPTFDPLGGEDITDAVVVDRLAAWLADEIVSLGVPRRFARGLVERGFLLPVLDGLDEMDPDGAPPERAAAVV